MKGFSKLPAGPVLGAVAGAAALAVLTFGPQGTPVGPGRVSRAQLTGADLVAYASCAQLLDQVKAEAVKEVGPYGLAGTVTPYYWGGVQHAWAASGPAVRIAAPEPMAPLSAASPAANQANQAKQANQPADQAGGTPGYSTTNDQEVGVDEPDMVKTNGQLMVVLRQQPLGVQLLDVSGPTPKLEGFLALPQLAATDGLFLSGQYAVVIASQGQAGPVPLPVDPLPGDVNPGGPMIPAPLQRQSPAQGQSPVQAQATPRQFPAQAAQATPRQALYTPVPVESTATTEVVVVSLTNPESPTIARTFTLQGYEQGARLINGQVVLVTESQPLIPWVQPTGPGPRAQQAALQANRRAIQASTASDWLPSVTASEGSAKLTSHTGCAKTYHTAMEAGLGTVSVVSLDPARTRPGNEVTVVGNAENVYASATQLFVATASGQGQSQGWHCPPNAMCPMFVPQPGTGSTDIYGFDISNPLAPTYLGSGRVPGTLIGQYAMSQYNGYLRVATTVGEVAIAPVDGGPAKLPSGHVVQGRRVPAYSESAYSESMVSVLQPQSGSLVTVGTLSGLGAGEKIYAVRFAADLAYVVTFRETDPLYVLNLSNPEAPALAGQVSLEGYSSFLQPLTSGLLLGIGQSVDANLRTEGLQLETFDVSQPSQPSLVSRQQLGDGTSSNAEYDPHALLWWPQGSLLVLPVSNYPNYANHANHADSGNSSGPPASEAQVWSVSSSGTLSEAGSVVQPTTGQSGANFAPGIERAVVVGQDLYTISEQGVMASDLGTLARLAWLAYGVP